MTDTDLITADDASTSTAGDGGSLATMVLPELRALANQVGVKGTSGMRKNELIAAIRENQNGGTPAAAVNGGAESTGESTDRSTDSGREPAESQQNRGENRDQNRDRNRGQEQGSDRGGQDRGPDRDDDGDGR
ncbi:MAG: Rho termination factor N-terminal domain-containing protein, partial [Mycobacteriaceae bacterium]